MNAEIPFNDPKYKRQENENLFTWEQRVFHVAMDEERKKLCVSKGTICDSNCMHVDCGYHPIVKSLLN